MDIRIPYISDISPLVRLLAQHLQGCMDTCPLFLNGMGKGYDDVLVS